MTVKHIVLTRFSKYLPRCLSILITLISKKYRLLIKKKIKQGIEMSRIAESVSARVTIILERCITTGSG